MRKTEGPLDSATMRRKTVGVYGKVLNVLEIKFKELGAECVEVEKPSSGML